ncbi:MAG: XdhC family protein, partial [Gammaproteobacteria bacterium]
MNDVLPTWLRWRDQGLACALITLVQVDGSAPRPVGSQMAVNERGDAVGNITGGCAEAAIIAEAQARLAAGTNRLLRYGKDSPYIDIRLPCGSGIDIFFDVCLGSDEVARIVDANAARQAAWLAFDFATLGATSGTEDSPPDWDYVRICEPVTRILAAGKGPLLPLLAELGNTAEFEMIVMSPEADTLEMARPHAREAQAMSTADAFRCGELDRWTAFLSLFHEHEWEPAVLTEALASHCFYIGALGSRRTAAARREALREAGIDDAGIARIRGPVGLPIGAKSPPEIALAILAEIVA